MTESTDSEQRRLIDNDLESRLKHLVDAYFKANSTPSNVNELCLLMTENIEALYIRADVQGLNQYREHVTTTLKTADSISHHHITAEDYDFFINVENEIVGSVRWKYHMELKGCCYCCCIFCCCLWPLCCSKCRKYQKSGLNTFKFDINDQMDPKISFVMTEYD